MTMAALKILCSRIPWCEPAVLESALELALEIAREGREGRRIGTLFTVGKSDAILAASRALILDPLAGHVPSRTHVTDPDLRGTIKELAQLDGAFVISEDGTVVAACRYLDASVEQIALPLGFGSRHLAAASISQRVGARRHRGLRERRRACVSCRADRGNADPGAVAVGPPPHAAQRRRRRSRRSATSGNDVFAERRGRGLVRYFMRVGGTTRREEKRMSMNWMRIALVGTILTIGGPVLAVAQSSQTKTDPYTWNGEFVSLETAAKTMTVKSRVAYQEAISELKHFKVGDRVWIAWSGIHDSSDAVRQVRRSEAGRKIDETLMLPAELVSTEAPNQYLTIRVKVPESGLSAINTVKPGEWVTVTSRHRPSSDDEAVVAVRPYGVRTTTE